MARTAGAGGDGKEEENFPRSHHTPRAARETRERTEDGSVGATTRQLSSVKYSCSVRKTT